MAQVFEFRIFPDAGGMRTEFATCPSESAAQARGGRLAKRHDCPVDIARDGEGDSDWSERYMTTASPSEHHAAGYRFERLD